MGKDEKALDDAPFEIPSFDEKAFIRKELISFKTTLVLFFFAIAIAGVSFLLWTYGPQDVFHATSSFLTGKFLIHIVVALGLAFLALKLLFKAVRIDISHWKRREWTGTYFLYFFFWLGFFLLFTNPPITDAAAPHVQLAIAPEAQVPGGPINFAAHISDNVAVPEESIAFCIHPIPAGGTPPLYDSLSEAQREACRRTFERAPLDAPIWNHTTNLTAGNYVWYIIAEDPGGARNVTWERFTVGNPFVIVDPPNVDSKPTIEDVGDKFTVRPASKNIRAVQYQIDGGEWYNMRPATEAGNWEADARLPGWHAGINKVALRVLEQPKYLPDRTDKGFKVDAAPVVDSRSWNVEVDPSRANDTKEDAPVFNERGYPRPGQAPGVAVPVILAALVAIVLVRRRSREA